LALLCSNHEFTNRKIMFPPSRSAADEREVLKATMAAQGLSVVELERSGIDDRGTTSAVHRETGGWPRVRRSR